MPLRPDPAATSAPLLYASTEPLKPSDLAMQAARIAFRQAKQEIEYFGAAEDFTVSPIQAVLEAAYEFDLRPQLERLDNADRRHDVLIEAASRLRPLAREARAGHLTWDDFEAALAHIREIALDLFKPMPDPEEKL